MEKLEKRTTVDMTKGNIVRHIILFALPIFLSQLFQLAYNTVDALVVGRFIGTEAIAATTSTNSLIFLLVSFNSGLATGAGVVIGKYFGAGQNTKVNKTIHTIILFGFIWGIVLSLFGTIFTPTILVWMNTDPEVLPLSVAYLRYYFMGGITIVLYNICTGIMNALGNSKRPLVYLIVSSVLNIILDILFVGVFKWGIWSAAVATVISQFFSVILCFIFLFRKGHVYTLELRKLKIDKELFIEIVKNGVPSGVQNSVIGFANTIVQSQINTFGKIVMASYGIYGKLSGFAFLPITSFSIAATTFISQNLGAKEYARAKQGSVFIVLGSIISAELLGLLLFFISPYLVGFYDKTPSVVATASRQMKIESLFFMFCAFSHAIAGICRGAGKPSVPMYIMLSAWCVIRVIYIAIVMKFFGALDLVFLAYPITWILGSIAFLLYYLKSNWVHGLEKHTGV